MATVLKHWFERSQEPWCQQSGRIPPSPSPQQNPSEHFISTANSIAEKAVKPQEPLCILNLHSSLFQKILPKADSILGKLLILALSVTRRETQRRPPRTWLRPSKLKPYSELPPKDTSLSLLITQGAAGLWFISTTNSCLQPSAFQLLCSQKRDH